MTLRATGQHPVAGKGGHDTPGSRSSLSSLGQPPAASPPPATAMSSWRNDPLGSGGSEPLTVVIIGECVREQGLR